MTIENAFSLQCCLRAASRAFLVVMILTGSMPHAPGILPPGEPVGTAQVEPITDGAVQIIPSAPITANDTGAEPPPDNALPDSKLPAEVAGKPELTDKRTANSATYDLGDGKYALVQESRPVHYQNGNGDWQRIDPAFVAETGGWINRTNALKTGIGARSGRANVTNGGLGVGWDPRSLAVTDASGNATLWAEVLPEAAALTGTLGADGRSVTYPASWSEPTLLERWASGYGQSEYSLRMAVSPAASIAEGKTLDLRVTLHLFPGTAAHVDGKPVTAADLPLETSGALTFVNHAGEMLLLQPPQAYEEGDPAQRVAGRYRLTPGAGADSLELAARIPYEWLSASERQYPVVLDPQFQATSPVVAKVGFYSNETPGTFGEWLNNHPIGLGQYADGVTRVYMYFDIPTQPPLTQIDEAYLEVTPYKGWRNCDYIIGSTDNTCWDEGPHHGLSAQAQLYALVDEDPANPVEWWQGNQEPQPGNAVGTQWMQWDGSAGGYTTRFTITSLVQSWQNPLDKRGVMLKLANEFCYIDRTYENGFGTGWNVRHFADDCGVFDIKYPSDDFAAADNQGGIRLVITYSGPTLAEYQVIPDSDDLPFGNPTLAPHEYTVEGLSGPPYYWQAIVARGKGDTFGVNPPTNVENPYGQNLNGTVMLDLRGTQDDVRVASEDTNVGSLSYVLLNRNISPAIDYHAWVNPNQNQAEAPLNGYDIQLIKEIESFQVVSGTTTRTIDFNTNYPLDLWNLHMIPGSHSRVDIEILRHNHQRDNNGGDVLETYDYVENFQLQLFTADSAYKGGNKPNISGGVTPMGAVTPYNPARLSSGIFTAGEDDYGVVLAYNGPPVSLYTCTGYCGPLQAQQRLAPAEMVVEPLEFTYRLRVTSCTGDFFPTSAGTCQEVKCPTSSFPADNRRIAGSLQLWSEGGWTTLPGETYGTSLTGPAPLIGPAGDAAPTVAVVGGDLSYNADEEAITSHESTVMLLRCQNPPTATSNARIAEFSVYQNSPMVSDGMYLYPAAWQSGNTPFNPWDSDAGISSPDFYINPIQGRVENTVTLSRRIGSVTRNFQVGYWAFAEGWPSLTSYVTPLNNTAPPAVAGALHLDLGSSFQMDTGAAGAADKRRAFVAVRATDAVISQPENMGGTSKPVQAVIVGQGGQANPTASCSDTGDNCLDVRAPDDAYPGTAKRNWQMPDIHINGEAGLVMVNSPGKLEAWSKDHPAMANRPQALSQNFSFDTFGGEVSVEQGRCNETDTTDSTIIKGNTTIALPMIGSADSDGMIAVGFVLCGNPETGLRQMTFKIRPPVGIPIGSTGLFATGLDGTIDITPSDTTLNFNLDFYYGDPGTFKGTGSVTISTAGMFQFQGNGKILGVVDGNGSLWVAWNPLDTGFELALHYGLGNIASIDGSVRAHAWRGQGWQHKYSWLPDNDEEHFAAQIAATFTLYDGALIDVWPLVIPPTDMSFGLEIAFGQFCTNSSCTTYEWGIKAAVEVCGYHAGIYYGFDHGVSVILGNDGHTLIDQYGGSTYARAVSGSEIKVLAAPQAVNGEVSLPVTVTADTEELLLGLGWQTGTLTMNLYRPNGDPVTPSPAFNIRISDTTRTDNDITTYSYLIGVQLKNAGPAMAGVWEARIGGITPEAHYKFAYLASTGTPGVPDNHGHFINPGAVNTDGTGDINIRWSTEDDAPVSTTISLYYTLYYSRTTTDPGLTVYTRTMDVPIIKNWNYHTGVYLWDTTAIKSKCNASELDPDCMFCYSLDDHCYYQIHAVVDDGVNDFPPGSVSDSGNFCQTCNNLPTEYAFNTDRFPGTSSFWSVGKVWLDYDTAPPSVPTGLRVSGASGILLARWNPNPVADKDLAAYLVEWGPVTCIATCSWVGGAPTHAERVAPVMTPTLRIGGVTTEELASGQYYGVAVSAVDINGNVSTRSSIRGTLPTNDPEAQIPAVPGAPLLSNPTSTSIRLTWSSDGSPDHYRLAYRQIRTSAIAQLDGINATYHTIGDYSSGTEVLTGLETGATYVAWSAAANSEDWYSTYSPPVTFTVSNGVDSDGDGMPDDWETAHQISLGNVDSDYDGVTDLNEYRNGTQPWEQDSDNDDFSDGEEVTSNTNPLDWASYPSGFTQPRLRLASNRANFYAKAGGNTQMFQDVSFYNDGGGTLNLTTNKTATWVTATVEAGVGKNYVRLIADASGLAPGIYDATVLVYQSSGPHFGGQQCIRVRLHLLPADDDIPRRFIYLPLIMRAYIPPQWVTEFVDDNDTTKQYISIAIDPLDDVPYISYYDATNGDLLMASRVGAQEGNCGKNQVWLCETLQSVDDTGQYSSIAIWRIARNWKIGIAYYNNSSHSLEYIEYVDGAGWTTTVVDTGSITPDRRDGFFSSLKFDASGNPHIAYYTWVPAGTDALKYAYYVGGGAGNCGDTQWNCDTIESGDEIGRYSTLDLDDEDRPHIAYYDVGSNLLRYAQFTGNTHGNCGPDNTWQCDTIESAEAPSGNERLIGLNALSVDSARIVYVAVISKTPTLRYADTTPGDCGPGNAWTCTTIIENVDGVALNTQGDTVRIAYHNAERDTLDLAHPLEAGNFGNCGPFTSGKLQGWQCEELEEGGVYPAIALRNNGLSIIAYFDTTDSNLKVANQKY